MKKCPYCAEDIQDAAIKCRYCGSDLVAYGERNRQPSEKSPEVVYYEGMSAVVTDTRAVLGGKTYAMAHITSVAMARKEPNYAGPGAAIVIGILLALCLLAKAVVPIGVAGLLLLGGGIVFATRLKPDFIVRLGSSSGETDGLMSQDQEQIEQIVNAVNQAIVDRR